MPKRLLAIGCAVTLLLSAAVAGQTARAGSSQPPRSTPTPRQSPTASSSTATQRELLDRYCVGCHNQRARASGQEAARKLTLDDLDLGRVREQAEKWELVVRRLRAGMMPPANSRRPDKAAYDGFISWLETELDRNATVYAPPPGLH